MPLISIQIVQVSDDLVVAGVADPGENRAKFQCGFTGLREPGYTKPILVAFPE
jgi:hypothetical protein